MKTYILLNKNDNVIVALQSLDKGTVIEEFGLTLGEDITMGHKIAIKDIAEGENIVKYGYPIAHATKDIKKASFVHTHNIKTNLSDEITYTYNKKAIDVQADSDRTFMGYKRKSGKVGIRNDVLIIPTVGCVNNVAEAIAKKSEKYTNENVPKVIAFTHPYGCSQMADDQENTRKILADLASHPNAGGVLLLGLGCENCGIETIKKYMGECDNIKFLQAQDVEDEVEAGIELVKELIETASQNKREAVSVSKLVVGLKCGGSDGLSGITANPTVGVFSDMLIRKGGTTILTEVPEMFGAETILMDRCESEEVFQKTVEMVNGFKHYFKSQDMVIYENPSPGNKKGGISTLEDKSLGCTQKSGDSPVVDVLSYAEKVKKSGLNLLYAPGNDLVASTALAASGAHIVLFTTGRGTPFASPVPTIKISSNSPLAQKKNNWIDFNCGVIVDEVSIEKSAEDLFEKVVAVAEGELVKAEKNDYYDMAIFKQGVTL
ncbi:MAG: altronate dehydratase family protein [Clostridia bacterium]